MSIDADAGCIGKCEVCVGTAGSQLLSSGAERQRWLHQWPAEPPCCRWPWGDRVYLPPQQIQHILLSWPA